jgi:hypothetical protein
VLKKHERTMQLTDLERKAISDMERLYEAQYQRHKGMDALARGESEAAIRYLTQANEFYRKWKLSAAVWMLRLMPRLVVALFRMARRNTVRVAAVAEPGVADTARRQAM